MTTLSLSPTTVFSLSETLTKIARNTAKCKAASAGYYFETAHVDVLRFIADPTDKAADNAVKTCRYAKEYLKSIRAAHGLEPGQRDIAHELVFNYFILERDVRTAQKIHELEKSEA